MKSLLSATGLAIAIAAAGAAAPAGAQQQEQNSQQQKKKAPKGGATLNVGDRTLVITAGALKPIQELQTAVNANDVANIPAKVAAAKAAATTADERYLVAKLQLQAAVSSKDNAAISAAAQDLLATGMATQQESVTLSEHLAQSALQANPAQAEAALQRVIALNPANTSAQLALASMYSKQGRKAEASAIIQKLMAQAKASGQKPDEALYKNAVALAHEAKSPNVLELSRSWVEAYPSPQNWRDALQLYINTGLDDQTTLDTLRLARAAGALTHEAQYQTYGFLSASSPAPAEAVTVIKEGVAAGKVNANKKDIKDILAEATRKSQGQRDRLPALIADAKASGSANLATNAADILYSYGDYAQAAEMYRAALGKQGADKNLLNLRLGMALARAGDKAGATTALSAVSGRQAELAKFWLAYIRSAA